MVEPKLQPTLAGRLRDVDAINYPLGTEDLCREAADALEAISAENAKLAEALAVIAYEGPEEPGLVAHAALASTARPLAALKEPKND